TIYALAKAAAQNMTLSTSLSSLDTMASMALAVKDIPLSNIAFVSYPAGATVVDGVGGVKPKAADAKVLMDAIAADSQIIVTGAPGGGAVAGDDVVETPPPNTSGGSSDPSSTPTIAPEGPTVVELPTSINGQQATEQTCTNGNNF